MRQIAPRGRTDRDAIRKKVLIAIAGLAVCIAASENLEKTDNELIFVEKGQRKSEERIAAKLSVLEKSLESDDSEGVRVALMRAVPTFHHPDDVNSHERCAAELKKSPARKWSAKKIDSGAVSQ